MNPSVPDVPGYMPTGVPVPDETPPSRGRLVFLLVAVPVLIVCLAVVFGSFLMPEWTTSQGLFKFQYRLTGRTDEFLADYHSQLKTVNDGRIPTGVDAFLIDRLTASDRGDEQDAILMFYALQAISGADQGGRILEIPHRFVGNLLVVRTDADERTVTARLLLVEQIRRGGLLPGAGLDAPRTAKDAYATWWAKSTGMDWSELRRLDPLAGTGISWRETEPTAPK